MKSCYGLGSLGSELERRFGRSVLAALLGRGLHQGRSRTGTEFLEQPRHIFAEAVVLDLEFVPGGVLVGDAVADIGCCARLQLAEPIRAVGVGGASHDEA